MVIGRPASPGVGRTSPIARPGTGIAPRPVRWPCRGKGGGGWPWIEGEVLVVLEHELGVSASIPAGTSSMRMSRLCQSVAKALTMWIMRGDSLPLCVARMSIATIASLVGSPQGRSRIDRYSGRRRPISIGPVNAPQMRARPRSSARSRHSGCPSRYRCLDGKCRFRLSPRLAA